MRLDVHHNGGWGLSLSWLRSSSPVLCQGTRGVAVGMVAAVASTVGTGGEVMAGTGGEVMAGTGGTDGTVHRSASGSDHTGAYTGGHMAIPMFIPMRIPIPIRIRRRSMS